MADLRLELILIPVADVDRAKDFYASLGWREDADFTAGDGLRVVQMTPTGSEASVIFGKGITASEPGSVQDLQLTVSDIDRARAGLAGSLVLAIGVAIAFCAIILAAPRTVLGWLSAAPEVAAPGAVAVACVVFERASAAWRACICGLM